MVVPAKREELFKRTSWPWPNKNFEKKAQGERIH